MATDELFDPDQPWNRPARSVEAALGAAGGLALAVFLLAVGLSRAVVAAAVTLAIDGEVPAPSGQDGWFVAACLATFSLGGALLGVLSPLLRSLAAKAVAGVVAGAVGLTAVVAVGEGGLAVLPRQVVVLALVLGGFFGALGGLAFGSVGRSRQNREEMDRRQEEIDAMVAAKRRSRARHASPRDPGPG